MNNNLALILAITVPCFTAVIGLLVNKHDVNTLRAEMQSNFTDIKNQIQHLIDLHINHAERIATLEERSKREGTNG